jgi:hypothetical protein
MVPNKTTDVVVFENVEQFIPDCRCISKTDLEVSDIPLAGSNIDFKIRPLRAHSFAFVCKFCRVERQHGAHATMRSRAAGC